MAKAKFKEKQQFNNKPVLVILTVIGLVVIWRGAQFLLQPQPDYTAALFLSLVLAAVGGTIWWLIKVELKVTVNEKGIKFKMSPNHATKRFIAWDEIESCDLVKTSELAQWSGGNITFNHERRVSLSGRNGLAIKTKAGKYYFIGSKDIDRLEETLAKIKRFKN